LREWSHEQIKPFFPRSARARCPYGAGAPWRVSVPVGAVIESIAPKIGCVPQTLHEWVRKHEINTGVRDGVPSEERDRIKALEREVKELRRANEILKLASAFFAQAELDRRLKS
jgi:transposase